MAESSSLLLPIQCHLSAATSLQRCLLVVCRRSVHSVVQRRARRLRRENPARYSSRGPEGERGGLDDERRWGREAGWLRASGTTSSGIRPSGTMSGRPWLDVSYTASRAKNRLVIEAHKESWQGKDTSARLGSKVEWTFSRRPPSCRRVAALGSYLESSDLSLARGGEIDIMESPCGFSHVHTEAYNHTERTHKGAHTKLPRHVPSCQRG